jgi:hypothetical protein
MGQAVEVLTGFVTAPGATLTALTMASGNSLVIRNTDFTKKIMLLTAWNNNQVAGVMRIRSPKLHDNVQGIRMRAVVTDVPYWLPFEVGQKLYPQDILTVELSGSGVAGQIETASLLVAYEDLPGAQGRFIGTDALKQRGVNLLTVETVHVTGVAGGYSGQVAINSSFDLLKANTDYALVGYAVDARAATIRWQGADVGNIGLGGPASLALKHVTSEWFVRLADWFATPYIPVFNSANKGGILIDVAINQAGGTVNAQSILVELAPAAR